jgi:hypothetical protein
MDTFLLWDRDTANVFGSYRTRDEVLEAVRGLLAANGAAIAQDLILVREDAAGVPTSLGGGESLALEAMMAAKLEHIRATFSIDIHEWAQTADWAVGAYKWEAKWTHGASEAFAAYDAETLPSSDMAEWLGTLTFDVKQTESIEKVDPKEEAASAKTAAIKQSTLALAA